MTIASATASSRATTWRTPAAIVLCGAVIAMLSFGPRSASGQFLAPLSLANHWGRDVFSLALALQNLLWGVGQPLAGGIADRYGSVRVLWTGAILYGCGLALMAYATTPPVLDLSAGVLMGLGLSGCSFQIVLGALGKLIPAERRSVAFGAATAAGSFGQFLFSPLARALIDGFDWQTALIVFALMMLAILPLAFALATPPADEACDPDSGPRQSLRAALAEAFAHRSYVLLVIGYFTCGFQLAFITVHLPSYLIDRGLSAEVGGWTIAVIGLLNIFGSLATGWLGSRMPKRHILAGIYFLRALAIFAFIMAPVSPLSSYVFGAALGVLWLSTVAPTNAIVAVMFGTRWLSLLSGFAFFSHQLGGFLGVWIGGFAFDRTGSYLPVWWLAIMLGILSALINIPIRERPVFRPALQAG